MLIINKIRLCTILSLILLLLLTSCAPAVEKGLVKTQQEIREIGQESEQIQVKIDALVRQDCCAACTYNYGKETLPAATPCTTVINENRASLYNVRSDEILDRCIELFTKEPRTIAACR